MKRHNAPQIDLPLFGQAAEPFALVQEATPDGARIEQERAQREKDREHARTLQKAFTGELEREQGQTQPGIRGTFHTY